MKKIVKLQRDFRWGWGSERRKIVWASWEKVCESRDAEGLGVINIKLFNVALLGKWIWRMGSSKDSLWKEVLESKYGGWRSLKVSNLNRFGSLWWKDLKKVWASKEWGDKFEDRVKWELGNGKTFGWVMLL